MSLATFGGVSVSLAQGYYGEPAPYGSSLDYSPGIYDLTPGYHSSPYAYDYYDDYGATVRIISAAAPGPGLATAPAWASAPSDNQSAHRNYRKPAPQRRVSA